MQVSIAELQKGTASK